MVGRGRRHARQDDDDLAGAPRCSSGRARPDRRSTAASSTPTAPTRGSAKATGWWSRPTRATAPSSSCRRRSPSSPTSTPSISTTTAISMRCARRSANFVANIPFYGFGVLCIDHPEVQALIPQVSDRKIVTYGLSPQADVRAVNVKLSAERRPVRRRRSRPRAAPSAPSPTCACRWSASTTCRTRWPRSPSRPRWASTTTSSARRSPASRASSAASPGPARPPASPSSTITATIRSRSPRCCARRAAPPRAA